MRKMYISRFNSLIMPFDLYSAKGKKEERALVDAALLQTLRLQT